MPIDTFFALARDFCGHAGLPAPEFEDEHCVLMLQPDQAVILAWDAVEEEVIVLAPVDTGDAPLDGDDALRLLDDAYLGQGLGGAAAGVDPGTGALVLWRRLPAYGITVDGLTRAVDRIAAAARACAGR